MMRELELIRRALVDEVGARGSVTDRVWDYLMREGHVASVQNGGRDVSWLSDRVRSFLEASGRWSETPQRSERMLSQSTRIGDRMLLLSSLLAKEADERDDVKRFRADVLGGQMLKPEQVEPWIQERTPKGRGEGMALTFEAPAGVEFTTAFRLSPPVPVTEIIGGSWRMLEYATPGATHVTSVATMAMRGELARLRFLSEDLAKQYHWQKAQATLFVLTGQIPIIPSFRWTVENPWPGPRRIALDVDLVLSPKDVAARYAEVRQRLQPTKARRRDLGDKHLALAWFVTERQDGEPWAKRLKDWNAQKPQWKYTQESNFRRDAGRAIERILTPIVSSHDVMEALYGDAASGKLSKKELKRAYDELDPRAHRTKKRRK